MSEVSHRTVPASAPSLLLRLKIKASQALPSSFTAPARLSVVTRACSSATCVPVTAPSSCLMLPRASSNARAMLMFSRPNILVSCAVLNSCSARLASAWWMPTTLGFSLSFVCPSNFVKMARKLVPASSARVNRGATPSITATSCSNDNPADEAAEPLFSTACCK